MIIVVIITTITEINDLKITQDDDIPERYVIQQPTSVVGLFRRDTSGDQNIYSLDSVPFQLN